MQQTLKINNIGCNGCVNTIKNELAGLTGVTFIQGSVPEKTITVDVDGPATLQTIMGKLVEIEYPAEPVTA